MAISMNRDRDALDNKFSKIVGVGLGFVMAGQAFGVTGKSRVTGKCVNVAIPAHSAYFELDGVNETTNNDNVLGQISEGALRVKVQLWAGPADFLSKSISFRIDLNALKETVGSDADHSIAQVYKPIAHQHFSFNNQEALAGSQFQHRFEGDGYSIDCSGIARFETESTYVELSDLKPHTLDLHKTRLMFGSQFIAGGKELCGVRIISTADNVEDQRKVLLQLYGTSAFSGRIRFDSSGGQRILPIRENVRNDSGVPSLRLQFPGYSRIGGGGTVVMEAFGERKSTGILADQINTKNLKPELLRTLQAEAITCNPE